MATVFGKSAIVLANQPVISSQYQSIDENQSDVLGRRADFQEWVDTPPIHVALQSGTASLAKSWTCCHDSTEQRIITLVATMACFKFRSLVPTESIEWTRRNDPFGRRDTAIPKLSFVQHNNGISPNKGKLQCHTLTHEVTDCIFHNGKYNQCLQHYGLHCSDWSHCCAEQVRQVEPYFVKLLSQQQQLHETKSPCFKSDDDHTLKPFHFNHVMSPLVCCLKEGHCSGKPTSQHVSVSINDETDQMCLVGVPISKNETTLAPFNTIALTCYSDLASIPDTVRLWILYHNPEPQARVRGVVFHPRLLIHKEQQPP
jgi:hypothetical protein